LLDVCPLSLGVETSGGIMTVIVPRNTTIPTKKTQTFSTYVDNQPGCSIQVYQGERKFAKDCVSLGSFNLSGIPPMPRGQPQIEITYDLDSNGILTVNALEKSSGKNEKITIKNDKNTLSKDDIDRMVKEAEKYADDDEKESQRLNAYNTLESSLYDYSSKLSKAELTDDEKNNSLDFVKEQQEWLSSNKLATNDLLNDKLNELNKYMEPFKDKLSSTNPTNNPMDNFNPADMMKNMNPDDMKGMQDMMKNMNPDELSKMMNMFKQPDNTKDNNN
jgi:L1 cell adhesion molecule like protein